MNIDPVVLYLDASDISNFAKIGTDKEDPKVAEVYHAIKKYVAEGLLVCGYSYIHIVEILKDKTDLVSGRFDKARAITDICGKNCFSYISEIFRKEFLSGLGREELPEISIFRNDGVWFPDVTDVFSDFSKQLDISAQEEAKTLSEGANRVQKRLIKKILRNKTYLGSTKSELKLKKDQLISKMSDYYGVSSDFFSDLDMIGVIKGNTKAIASFTDANLRFMEPEIFIGHTVEVLDAAKNLKYEIPGFLHEFENSLFDSVTRFASDLQKLNLNNKDYKRIAKERMSDFDMRLTLKKYLVDELKLNDQELTAVKNISLGELPALDFISNSQKQYLDDHALTTRKVRKSDGGDFMHGFYAPYCDIFRCDGYFSGVFQRSLKMEHNKKIQTSICGSLFDLPELIEKRCNTKGSRLLA